MVVLCLILSYKSSFAGQVSMMIEAISHGEKEMASLSVGARGCATQEWVGASSIILSFFNKWFFLSAVFL